MPTKTGKPYNTFYGNDLAIDQAGNTGCDEITRYVQDGFGNNTALRISDDTVSVTPQDDLSTSTFGVTDNAGNYIFRVDTGNKDVKAGETATNVLTLEKEMGLYEFSPAGSGYHYPLIANRVGMQGAEGLTSDNDWGSAEDPPTTLDVSGLADPENAVAVYWFIESDMELDSVRFMAVCDGAETLNFHLFSYDLDTSTNHGDLSNGAVVASGTVDTVATGLKVGTLTINAGNIDANKIVIGFVENATSTDDFSVTFNIRYHMR